MQFTTTGTLAQDSAASVLSPFLRALHPDPDGWYVLWEQAQADTIGTFTPFRGRDLGNVVKHIKRRRKHAALYVSLGTQAQRPPHGKRGFARDVRDITMLWAEIDTAEGPHATPADQLPPDTAAALQLIDHLPEPSAIFHTGGGIQVYWRLDRAANAHSSIAMPLVEAIQWSIQQRAAAQGWHTDMVADAARVFRLPETSNFKTDPAKPVQTLQCNLDRRYSLDDYNPDAPHWASRDSRFDAVLAQYRADARAQAHLAARRHIGATISKYPSVETYNHLHAIEDMLSLYGYTRHGQRWRHPGADHRYAPGVVVDKGANVAYLWDLADPAHHGKQACACVTPFSLAVTYEHDKNWGNALATLRAEGWHDEDAYELPVNRAVHARYLNQALDRLPAARAICIKSPVGTGKTEFMAQVAAAAPSVLVIGHRKGLLGNLSKRLNLTYYEDLFNTPSTPELAAPDDEAEPPLVERLAITLDSLPKLSMKQRFSMVIIDEAEQVLRHACGTTVKPSRELTLRYFKYFQQAADQVVYLDADLGRITHRYASRLFGARQVCVVDNTYATGTKEFIAYDKKGDLDVALQQALRAGQKLAIGTSSYKHAEHLEALITQLDPTLRMQVVHGNNSDQPDVRAFIRDINTRVAELDVLIYSPAINTGVSIDPIHFDAVYIYGDQKPLTHTDLYQMAGRVRTPRSGQVHCWIDKRRGHQPTNVERIRRITIEQAHKTHLLALGTEITFTRSGDGEVIDDEYLQLHCDAMSEYNASINDIRHLFYQLVRHNGHQVRDADAPDPDQVRTARAINQAIAATVFGERVQRLRDAIPLSPDAAAALREKLSPTEEEKVQLLQYELCRFYDIEPDGITDALLKADEDGLRYHAELLAMILNPTIPKVRDTVEIQGQVLTADVGNYQRAAQLRRRLIDKVVDVGTTSVLSININPDVVPNSPPERLSIVIPPDFAVWLEGQRDELYALLNITIPRNIAQKPQQFVTGLFRQLGMRVQSVHPPIDKATGKRPPRRYFVAWDDVETAVQWARRWETLHAHYTQMELAA